MLQPPYWSPATVRRRGDAALLDRRAGVDLNVSHVVVVSVDRALTGVRATTIVADHRPGVMRAALRARRRARALDRSRRASHAAQYRLSRAQERRASRRERAGLSVVQASLPRGPRVSDASSIPRQALRHDSLSRRYQEVRGRGAVAGAAQARTGRDRARRLGAEVVATHGASLIVEETDCRPWARRWGRGVGALGPGRLRAAIRTEAWAVSQLGSATGVLGASTRTTALSQHRLCGRRVAKRLSERTHHCPGCGLEGDRDRVAALLAAFVTLSDPADPGTARVDYSEARRALARLEGLQAALTESSAAPPGRRPRRRDGRAQAGARRRRAARRTAGPAPQTTPDERPTAGDRAAGDHAGAFAVRAGPDPGPLFGQDLWSYA